MISEDGDVELYELTNENLKQKCREWNSDDCICCLEHVGSSPQMGVTSAFNFGDGFGQVKGILEALEIPYELVHPIKWKKLFSCTLGKSATTKEKKEKDLEVARRLFPHVDFKRTAKCKSPWYDAADAILLAEYGRRMRR